MTKRRLTVAEKAWAAGYADGEACFSLLNGSSPLVRVGNTHLPTLHEFAELWGGRVAPHSSKSRASRRRNMYVWYVMGDHARQFLRDVLPYLREKRAQADILLGVTKMPPRGSTPMPQDERDRRDEAVRLLSELKRIEH